MAATRVLLQGATAARVEAADLVGQRVLQAQELLVRDMGADHRVRLPVQRQVAVVVAQAVAAVWVIPINCNRVARVALV